MGNFCESSNNHQKKHNSLELSNEEFPDMPLWNNGKKTGFGIKEMPAYKCELEIDLLEKKRKLFWNSHKRHLRQWDIIHQACIYPHIKAEEYLAKYNFRTLDGCINMCVDPEGNIYRVPNYCINDPYFELELLPKNGGNDNNLVNIILYDVSLKKKTNLNISENITGAEIIKYYAQQNKIDLNRNTIRLLFGGGLIRNDETLYQHKVKDGQMIQVSIFKNN
jgi:hypothetical protein